MFKYYLALLAFTFFSTVQSNMESQERITCEQSSVGEFADLIAPIVEKAKSLACQHANNKNSTIPIIAIAGCSAVGKSTFARKLSEVLNEGEIKATIFKQDDFLQPTHVENTTLHPYFDYHRLHNVLRQVIDGQEYVEKPVWNKNGPKPVKEEIMASFCDIDLIIFEGIYTLWGADTYDFSKYSAFKIFIDAPLDVISVWNWERELQRGERARSKEKFDSDIAWDMEDYRNVILPAKKVADVVIEKDANHSYLSIHYKTS